MPGVNVAIVGTTQGAVADVDGFYFINNVRPGTYVLRASFIGFVSSTTENVRVSTGLTTDVNFEIREQAVGLAEIVVTSERPIVQLDVSANVASLDPADFEDLPIAGVSDVLDLQAGIEPGLQIRGGGLGEIAFFVDGLNMRTGRDNEPFTNISYTSLEEVQVQTGGFNAEYGNVRAGIVNVVTKEPPCNHYTFDGIFRYAPAQDKSFEALDGSVLDGCDFSNPSSICDSWWVRGATDPEVAFVGTDDPYTASQYRPFEGWNAVADRLNNTVDVTPHARILSAAPSPTRSTPTPSTRSPSRISKRSTGTSFPISGMGRCAVRASSRTGRLNPCLQSSQISSRGPVRNLQWVVSAPACWAKVRSTSGVSRSGSAVMLIRRMPGYTAWVSRCF